MRPSHTLLLTAAEQFVLNSSFFPHMHQRAKQRAGNLGCRFFGWLWGNHRSMAVQSPARFVSNVTTFVSFSKQLRERTISFYRRQDFEKTLMRRERAGGGETTEAFIIVHPENFLKKSAINLLPRLGSCIYSVFVYFQLEGEEEEEERPDDKEAAFIDKTAVAPLSYECSVPLALPTADYANINTITTCASVVSLKMTLKLDVCSRSSRFVPLLWPVSVETPTWICLTLNSLGKNKRLPGVKLLIYVFSVRRLKQRDAATLGPNRCPQRTQRNKGTRQREVFVRARKSKCCGHKLWSTEWHAGGVSFPASTI